MKKQLGVIVVALAMAQFASAAITAIELAKRTGETVKIESIRGLSKDKILESNRAIINDFARTSGSSPEVVANNLSRRPELAETYVAMLMAEKSTDASDKQFLDRAQTVMSNFGTAKGIDKLSKAEVEIAKSESPAVVKFVEILPLLKSYGPKAEKMGDIFAQEIRAGLSLNKALRSAAQRALGLTGNDLDVFMRDPAKGLANCTK